VLLNVGLRMTYNVEICSYNNKVVLADLTTSKHVDSIIKLC